jgi:hypothetical protein
LFEKTSEPVNQHLIFQDEEQIGLAEQFGTTEELINRTHNRLTKEQLQVSSKCYLLFKSNMFSFFVILFLSK